MNKRTMEHDFDYDTLKSGHLGPDVLRETAIKTFEPETRHLDLRTPESFSAPDRTRMRLYKKGGHVQPHKKGERIHPLNHDQSDLHIPRRSKNYHVNQPLMEKVEHKKHGGKIEHRKSKIHQNHMSPEVLHVLMAHLHNIHGRNQEHKGHGKRQHRYDGGSMMLNDPNSQNLTNPVQNPITMKRGGKMARKANGGTIYEREMVGERPSRHAPHFDYESQMRGERCVSKAPVRRSSKAGRLDESMGTTFKRGGHAHKKHHAAHHADGGMSRYKKGSRVHKDLGGFLDDFGKGFAMPFQWLGNAAQALGPALPAAAMMLKKGGRTRKAEGGAMEPRRPGMPYKKGGRTHHAHHEMEHHGHHASRGRRVHRGFGGDLMKGFASMAPGMLSAAGGIGANALGNYFQNKSGTAGALGRAFAPALSQGLGNVAGGLAQNYGQNKGWFKKGGKVHQKRAHHAIGGVGKIRHEEATTRGKQINKPSRRVPRGGGC